MQAALRATQEGRLGATRLLLAVALAVQATYFGLQIHLFLDDLAKFTPGEHAYGSIYFTLVGVHHAHVLVGILLNVWLLLRLASGVTTYRVVGVRSATFYWHFVNLLAVVVTAVQLSPAL
jgi:heme/copper-type cytochrome/quinol oxidase subunit 3